MKLDQAAKLDSKLTACGRPAGGRTPTPGRPLWPTEAAVCLRGRRLSDSPMEAPAAALAGQAANLIRNGVEAPQLEPSSSLKLSQRDFKVEP